MGFSIRNVNVDYYVKSFFSYIWAVSKKDYLVFVKCFSIIIKITCHLSKNSGKYD